MGIWFVFTIAIPAALKVVIDNSIEVHNDGELLLTQREAVNDGRCSITKAKYFELKNTFHDTRRILSNATTHKLHLTYSP